MKIDGDQLAARVAMHLELVGIDREVIAVPLAGLDDGGFELVAPAHLATSLAPTAAPSYAWLGAAI